MNFEKFKTKVQRQFESMTSGDLFVTNTSKGELWETYLLSFPEGTDPLFRERTEHDCQCCKSFIRQFGNVVAIKDDQVVSIWDIEIDNDYQVVADALSAYVKTKAIRDIYLNTFKKVGTDFNFEDSEPVIQWNHFYVELPSKFISGDVGTKLSAQRSNKEVFQRGLAEITKTAVDTVLDLLDQGSLYRGEEHRATVQGFRDLLNMGNSSDEFCWVNRCKPGARIRNSAIGTLLVNLSEGMSLDTAVGKYESIVAPANYKRPKALVTEKMIRNAQEKVKELGIVDSLPRRHSTIDDIRINNILFADRSAKEQMNVFDEMVKDAPVTKKKLGKIEEVSIDTFINDILPNVEMVEILMENRHEVNLMSLISPVNQDSKPIFQWPNNFSWTYNGEVADSMKERVAKAGGSVTGVLRFSIQWNDGDNNQNDFDAHCDEPNGNRIFFSNKRSPTGGNLDVDIINPGRGIAVENITWPTKSRMLEGRYQFLVHNYSHKGGKTGFTAEIEYGGVIHSYVYNKGLREGERINVAELNFSKKDGIKFIKQLPSTSASKEIWGVQTEQFSKISVIMNSPNHWDEKQTGNKHYFFIVEGCDNPNESRTMYNEFLSNELHDHRKVFEHLGAKLKAEYSDKQLSGLGFSTTKRNSIVCKVTGSFTRTLKINF